MDSGHLQEEDAKWANKKHFSKLKNESRIWSSSTLYTSEIKEVRKIWFQNWLKENELTAENILKFHHSEIGDKEQAVLMKRDFIETVSITSVIKENNDLKMIYEDVIHSEFTALKII